MKPAWRLLLPVIGWGCTQGDAGPSIGVLAVVTATAGPSPDVDGYTVRIDASQSLAIGVADTVHVSNLGEGLHRVALEGVAVTCGLDSPAFRTADVTAGDTTVVVFDVTCADGAGILQVATLTTGSDLDPSGYVVTVDSAPVAPVMVNAVAALSLPIGVHDVRLSGVAANCELLSPTDSRTVSIVRGGLGRAEFALECSPTLPAGRGHEIAFVQAPPGLFPSGQILDRIHLMNEDGTSVRPLAFASGVNHVGLAWLPGGSQLSFLGINFLEEIVGTLYVMDVTTGALRPGLITNRISVPQWSPDGSKVVYTEGSCTFDCDPPFLTWVVIADPDGSNRVVVAADSVSYGSPAWYPDGSGIVYVRRDDVGSTILRNNPAGVAEQPLWPVDPGLGGVDDLAWAPDGSRLVFTGPPAAGTGAASQIYSIGADGTGLTALTGEPGSNWQPAWSADSRRIAFVSDRDGDEEIYVMDSDGENQQRLTNRVGPDFQPAWRP